MIRGLSARPGQVLSRHAKTSSAATVAVWSLSLVMGLGVRVGLRGVALVTAILQSVVLGNTIDACRLVVGLPRFVCAVVAFAAGDIPFLHVSHA
jgi:hypothetical protein